MSDNDYAALKARALSQPLVEHIYTADPSAHVFNGRIYIYPSHDRDSGIPSDSNGSQYDMVDYHVLSMDRVGAPVIDHGVADRRLKARGAGETEPVAPNDSEAGRSLNRRVELVKQ